jgi:leucine-rich repeat protein SHOC2
MHSTVLYLIPPSYLPAIGRLSKIADLRLDRICQELDAIDLDTWREYTLLKIEVNIEDEPMVLLKMTCPSTGHIHILRVPPEMASAEAAITWVNHGIHPDEFSVQT